ncbi:MAG: hypothetical protein KGH56_03000 [Patescibacteria group bacterium]|nr:hypothetical protein [Patescibacteria group bacterium]
MLYRCVEHLGFPDDKFFAIIRSIDAQTVEEAVERFWPYEGDGRGKECPPFSSSRWEKTSGWLYSVAATDRFAIGSCVKVGKAARDRRQYYKEEPPELTSPSPEPETETLLQRLEREKNELSDRLWILRNPKSGSRRKPRWTREEDARLSSRLASVEEQIASLQGAGAVSTAQKILDEVSQMQAAQ